jgi:transposase-like protein
MRRRREIHRNRILRCPTCGSTQLEISGGLIMGQVYHCLKCNYVGSLVFETDVADDGTPLA